MTQFHFSSRTHFAHTANPYLERIASLRQIHKDDWVDLTLTDPTGWPEREMAENAALSLLSEPRARHYQPDSLGLWSARETLSTQYGCIPANQWVLTASTSEAYTILFRLLCNPGDRILVPAPSYPLLEHLAQFDHVGLETYPLRWTGSSWVHDISHIERGLKAGARAVVVIQPGNPTGVCLSSQELSSITRLCAKYQAALIADEVFSTWMHSSRSFVSCLGNSGCLTFTLGGLSKSLGLPQFKLGWIGCSGPFGMVSEALQRLELLNDTLLSASSPVQVALPQLWNLSVPLQGPLQERLRTNHEAWLQWSARLPSGYTGLPVDGGWCVCLRFPEFVSEEDFLMDLAERFRVQVIPGYFFEMPWNSLVLSLLCEPRLFHRGLNLLLHKVDDTLDI